nr:TRAP transporter substrate-binding protein [uncultured Albidiferax sp.]
MKQVWKATLCAAALGHAALAGAQTTWKLASGYRAESFQVENLAQFAKDVAAATQQQLKIELLPNGQAFKLGEIRSAVEDGRLQAGETIMSGMVQEIPLAGADSVPFVVGSYQDAQRLWQLQRPVLAAKLAERGLSVLYAVPWPPQGLYSTKPIRSLADLRGTRMRSYNQTTLRIAEMLGAKPVDVPMADVGQALQDGRVDSMITSAVTGVENKVWGAIHYYYDINAWFPKNLVFASTKSLDALPAEVRAHLLKAAALAERRGWASSEVEARKAVQTLQAHGIKLDRLPADMERDLQRMGERFSREWVRSMGHEASAIFVPYYFN